MGEVETQVLGRHERTLLADVIAEHGPQRRVQQVGRRVVAPDRLAAIAVDSGERVLSRPHLAGHPRPVRHQPGHGQHGVLDLGDARLGHDGACVPHLAAALGVEGRAVQEDLDDAPGAPVVGTLAVFGSRRRSRRRHRLRPRARPPPGPAPRSSPGPGRRTSSSPPPRAARGTPPRRRPASTSPRHGPARAGRPWRHRNRPGPPRRRRHAPAPRSTRPGSHGCRAE